MKETTVNGPGEAYTRLPAEPTERCRERYQDRYERSHEGLARMVVYLGPYVFWATVGAITAAALLLGGWKG